MRVLIIDDEEDIRKIASLSLSKVGKMTVTVADSGAAGIVKAVEEKPDVILLDMMMPEMDGPATLRALRAQSDLQEIPVVFLTARDLKAELGEFRKLGVVGALSKPFDLMTLPAQVQTLLHTVSHELTARDR